MFRDSFVSRTGKSNSYSTTIFKGNSETNLVTECANKEKLINMMKKTPYITINIFLVLILGTGFLPASHGFSSNANIQPVLAYLATRNPGEMVHVIVQKTTGSSGTELQVARLGGKITKDLSIINAVAAEMTAGSALHLSRFSSVRWISLDASMMSTACSGCIDTASLANAYVYSIRANQVWNSSAYLQGNGIGVAVVDSGINPNGDLYTIMGVNRQVADVRFNNDHNQTATDGYGHGTHVSSVVGGDGSESGGKYIGVAPMVNIINVKVSNDDGSATMADVVAGLQWVLENKDRYNIRVVNLSINSSVAESYNTSPLDAAVEILWFNKIVVVVSAGNKGSGAVFPPANDPFVITVGATNDKGTNSISDDVVASFSGYGKTTDGFNKPDIVAPGTNIIARLVNQNQGLAGAHPLNRVGTDYFVMSGTSMAAPMVSGAIALLLQDEPALTPDQVKYRLMSTANKSWKAYSSDTAGSGYLDVYAAVQGTTKTNANSGIQPSKLLYTGSSPMVRSPVGWNSVGWNSVGWNSVGWNSVGWNSVGWNSDYWGP
jgi:Subtilisin-like serine proteases